MTQEVHTRDGRTWLVWREINWASPPRAQEFEHDVAAGHVAGIVMMTVVFVMLGVVVYWTPADVVIPGWLLWIVLIVLLAFPAQWATARPWTIVAATQEPLETAGERWEGTVRGLMASRREVSRVARNLQERLDSRPDDDRGPLEQVSLQVD